MSTPRTVRAAEEAPALIKHWRTFGPEEWGHVREGALGLFLGSLLPVGLFYVTYRVWGLTAAIVAVLAWSGLVFAWHRRRTGGADVFSATTFGFACTKALTGLVSQNQTLYLAFPSFENLIYGAAFFGSALLGRPLLALYAQRLYPIPESVRATDLFRRVFLVTSAVWLVGLTLRATIRIVLLRMELPLEVYLIADTVAGWPINASLVAFTGWYPLRQLHRAGYMDIQPAHLSAMDTVELVVEESAPGTV
jgi:intracellular septation protein A